MDWDAVKSLIRDYDCDEERCINNAKRVVKSVPDGHFNSIDKPLAMAAAIVYCSHDEKQRSDVRRGLMRLNAVSRYKKHLQSGLGAAAFDEIFNNK